MHFVVALGFYHMQSSSDRDNYVNILWENIIDGMQSNFNAYSPSDITRFSTPYDYQSIMHYGAYAFSKNGLPTIVPHVSIDLHLIFYVYFPKIQVIVNMAYFYRTRHIWMYLAIPA